MVVPADYLSEYVLKNNLWEEENKIIGSLASHLGILYDEFDDILAARKLSKVQSWQNNLGLSVQTNKDHYITWIALYKAFTPL